MDLALLDYVNCDIVKTIFDHLRMEAWCENRIVWDFMCTCKMIRNALREDGMKLRESIDTSLMYIKDHGIVIEDDCVKIGMYCESCDELLRGVERGYIPRAIKMNVMDTLLGMGGFVWSAHSQESFYYRLCDISDSFRVQHVQMDVTMHTCKAVFISLVGMASKDHFKENLSLRVRNSCATGFTADDVKCIAMSFDNMPLLNELMMERVMYNGDEELYNAAMRNSMGNLVKIQMNRSILRTYPIALLQLIILGNFS